MLATIEATQVDFMATLKVIGIVMLWAIASAGSLEKIWLWFTGGSKRKEDALNNRLDEMQAAIGQFVDKDALEKRFGAIDSKQQLHAAEQVNQHNTLMEYERKRTELSGEFRAGISQLQEKVHLLEAVPGRVDKLESKLDNLTNQIGDLKSGQRDLRNELREDMRSNKGEILEAIKSIR